MSKGQSAPKRIKQILKFFKLNENIISTIMGGVVVVVIAGLIFNYFRTTNLKSWQGTLLSDQEAISTSTDGINDKLIAVHRVVRGEDLWHIAERYYRSGYNYVDIMNENGIGGQGVIVPGQDLRIPKVEARNITIAETKEIAVGVEESVDTSLSIGAYTIQKGDSYWSIAVRAYGDGFQWTKIYWENKTLFPDPDLIYSGVTITIPAR